MRLLLTLVAVFLTIGCAEEIPDVSGVWKGTTSFVVDGEEKTIPLELELTQEEKEIAGSICWGEVDQAITSTALEGNEVFLKSEWDEGTIMLRGLVVGDGFQGRFTYTYVNDPLPYPANFELKRGQ